MQDQTHDTGIVSPSSTPSRLGTVMDKLTSNIFNLGEEFIEFKHVMAPFPNPILITTSELKIIYVNPSWEQLSGYKLEEVQGKNPSLLQSGKTPAYVYKKLWKYILAGKSFTTEGIINRKKDGTEYQINSTIFPVQHNGNTLFYVQVEEDITQRKKLEELKEQFIHEAAHELKTPITALKLLLEWQMKRIKTKYKDKDILLSLELIDRDLDRLTKLINEFSDVTRIEAGKLCVDIKIIDITKLVSEVIETLKALNGKHTIEFNQTESIFVFADPDRIRQVLINLISNSMKYSEPYTIINIEIQKSKTKVTVSVSDTGVGIPKHKLPLIFNRYYQIEKNRQVGLGLGLYIAREIIKKHNAEIWAESEVGVGSTFYFTLKRANNTNYHR